MNAVDKQEFADWVKAVTENDYKARHEFKQVGLIPDFVMNDIAVKSLKPFNNEIHVSDYQLRHALRQVKTDRGASLTANDVSLLPDKLEGARWFYDDRHNNVIAAFALKNSQKPGKAVVSIKFSRGGNNYNAVTTMGIIEEFNLKHPSITEIKAFKP